MLLLKRIAQLVLLLMLLLAAVALLWWWLFDAQYQLDISNESSERASVRVFGSGVLEPRVIFDIKAGEVATILVDLKPQGELRFEVAQGGSKIDTFIARDIDQLERSQHWLTIEANHHFTISGAEGSAAD